MPARRKAGQNKATSGRSKRAAKKIDGTSTRGPRRKASAAAIREKTPTPRKQRPDRESVTERRKRKTGIADSAITAPKPRSNKTTPKQKTARNKKTTTPKSGQTPARRKRAAAPTKTRARKRNTGGKQAKI